MKALFVHQNFPGQFVHLAPALVASGWQVHALTCNQALPAQWQGVEVVHYQPQRGSTPGIHPWVVDFETQMIRAEACLQAALRLQAGGYVPDVIVAHPGWGESQGLHRVWPGVPMGVYCEFFYHAQGADVGFDPEFGPVGAAQACRTDIKNTNNLLTMQRATAGLSPTRWQASRFPEPFRSRISVVHDGIDTVALAPNAAVQLNLNSGAGQPPLVLTRESEVVTFVNRNLEPYRGFHTFMRALPELLRRRPQARVLVVGGNGVGYGAAAPGGGGWRALLEAEVRPRLGPAEWGRVHFLGTVPRAALTALLQVSTVHVYLTYPFVLSWSLLEAMSMGCAIVGSRTAPVQEVLAHAETGWLVDFFDAPALADAVAMLCEQPDLRARLGTQARAECVRRFDLQTVCLPGQVQWVRALAGLG